MFVNYTYQKTPFYDNLLIKTLVNFMTVKYNPSLISCNKVFPGIYLETNLRQLCYWKWRIKPDKSHRRGLLLCLVYLYTYKGLKTINSFMFVWEDKRWNKEFILPLQLVLPAVPPVCWSPWMGVSLILKEILLFTNLIWWHCANKNFNSFIEFQLTMFFFAYLLRICPWLAFSHIITK